MLSVCLYFHVHQPYRVRRYRVFDIGNTSDYFSEKGENDLNNERILRKVAGKSYRPAGELFLELLERYPELRLAFSFSGVVIEQLEQYAPDILKLYQKMVKTGRVEIVGETYYHSLAFFHSLPEFERQVEQHAKAIKRVFGIAPKVFRNTELSYNNALGLWAEKKGYAAILTEGWDYYLGWRSPAFVYKPPGDSDMKVLLKHYKLSDDIAFRFQDKGWAGWPVTADKFAHWVHAHHGNGQVVNLFMDYETFGEHNWVESGIFDFLRHLPAALLSHPNTDFKKPSEVARSCDAVGVYDVPGVVTWADTERDLTAWMGNDLQRSALHEVYLLEKPILENGDRALVEDWRRLQTSDHFYYMCTKWANDGDIHAYFSPYQSPYDAYIAFRNALEDLKQRVGRQAEVVASV